ncbi:MAG: MFS transporter [Anaerolineae bacterium]|nr:MFS transporter [Anaerolineae bacterium]
MRAAGLWDRFEGWLVGHLAADVRHNMRVDLGTAVLYGAFVTVLAFMPQVLRRLGAPADLLALYGASAYLGNILAGPGLLLARQGHPLRMAVASWSLARAALAGAALVSGHVGMLVLAAVFWLGEGLPGPLYSAIVQHIYPVSVRGRVMAVVRVGMSLTLLTLAPLAGWALDRVGYRVLFPLAALIGVVSAVLFLRIRLREEEIRLRGAPTLRHFTRILTGDGRFVLYLTGVVLFGLSSLVPSAIIPLVQVDRLRLSYTELGWLNMAFSLARLLSYFYWGRLIDRWGPVRCLQAAFLINIVAVLPYAWVTAGWMLVPSFVASGLVNSAIDLGFITAAIQLADPEQIQEYAALQSMVIGARGIVGPFLGVGLLRLGVAQPAIFIVASVLGLMAVLVFLLLARLAGPSV